MKKTVFWNIIYSIILLLMLAGEGMAVRALIRLNMLPKTYLLIIASVLALFALLVGLLLFWKGKKPGKFRRILACVLAVLVFCSCAVITTVVDDLLQTLAATSSEESETAVRAVYVRKDNPAGTLADTVGFTYGYVKNYDESCTQQVLEQVNTKTGSQVFTAGYHNAFLMTGALLDGKIDAIILNGGYLSILEDTEGFENISESIRMLAVVEVTEPEEPVEETVAEEEILELPTEPLETERQQPEIGQVDYSALEPFLVYVSGSDSYDSQIVMNGRSDVNILAAVNPMTRQILLINTPRDYYVKHPFGGKEDKLTHCGLYGTSCSMKALGNLYDTSIDYYVRINFTGFKKLIDAMGGITVYSDYPFTAITRTPIQEGENHLNGQQALDFARERYTLKGGDNERGKHQMQVITAVIEKATSGSTIISNYSEIMESVEGMFSMNVPVEMIGNLMKLQLTDMAGWNVVSYAVTGTDSMEECYSVPGMELSVIKPYWSSVNKATRLIDMVCQGELLTEEVINSIT